mgnify:CR=1 FL=1
MTLTDVAVRRPVLAFVASALIIVGTGCSTPDDAANADADGATSSTDAVASSGANTSSPTTWIPTESRH